MTIDLAAKTMFDKMKGIGLTQKVTILKVEKNINTFSEKFRDIPGREYIYMKTDRSLDPNLYPNPNWKHLEYGASGAYEWSNTTSYITGDTIWISTRQLPAIGDNKKYPWRTPQKFPFRYDVSGGLTPLSGNFIVTNSKTPYILDVDLHENNGWTVWSNSLLTLNQEWSRLNQSFLEDLERPFIFLREWNGTSFSEPYLVKESGVDNFSDSSSNFFEYIYLKTSTMNPRYYPDDSWNYHAPRYVGESVIWSGDVPISDSGDIYYSVRNITPQTRRGDPVTDLWETPLLLREISGPREEKYECLRIERTGSSVAGTGANEIDSSEARDLEQVIIRDPKYIPSVSDELYFTSSKHKYRVIRFHRVQGVTILFVIQ